MITLRETNQRYSLIRWACLAVGLIDLGYAFTPPFVPLVTGVRAASGILLLVVALVARRLPMVGLVTAALVLQGLVLTINIYHRGGVEAASYHVLPFFPLVATWGAGRRVGTVVLISTVLLVEGIFALDTMGYPFPKVISPDQEAAFHAHTTAILAVLCFGFALLFEASRDRTERIRLEAVERLRTSEHLAALGTMTAGVAHEINNPLAYVQANLAYVKDSIAQGALTPETLDEVRDALRDAEEGVVRASRIVRDMRSLSASEDAKRSEAGNVPLAEVMDLVLRVTAHETRQRARVECDLDRAPPVWGEREKLQQVFIHLVVNAAHAIEPGHASENAISIHVTNVDEARVTVAVDDTGAGIAQEHIDAVFQPFFTTKSPGRGVGLGLSITHRMVTELGGEVRAHRREGGGTRFEVVLPRAVSETSTKQADGERSEATRSHQGLDILIVDDEARFRRALQRTLSHHRVQLAASGADARQVLELKKQSYDVILCDLVMPNMSGYELYGWVRRFLPELAERFVFMTGGAVTSEAERFVTTTVQPVLYKPLESSDLEEAFRKVAGDEGAPDGGRDGAGGGLGPVHLD